MKIKTMLPQRKTFSFEWHRLMRSIIKQRGRNTVRLTLALIIGLALVSSLPIPAQAQSPVDLVVEGEGATSWDIANIMPGASGTKTVTLRNTGYNDGFVTIWISNVVSSEGTNPESETGDTSEPGELIDYLLLNLSCNRLSTNLSLPATIDDLPQSASAQNYIKISPLNAGNTVSLAWQWELPPQVGNDVQGDSLSFTINYVLEEFPPSPPESTGDPGEDGYDGTTYLLEIDILGKITRLEMRYDGTIIKSCSASDPNGNLILEINSGTKVTCDGNRVPQRLVGREREDLLPTSDSMVMLSPVYDFNAYIYEKVSQSVTFDPPLNVLITYDPEELPENASSIFIAYWDEELGWTELEPLSGFVATAGTVAAAQVSHLTPFALIAKLAVPPPVMPANFKVGNLTINPSQAQLGQPITISLTVTNTGATTLTNQLHLMINGEMEAVKEITVDANSIEIVSFEVSQLGVGGYQVEIAGLTGQFSVVNLPLPANPPASPVKLNIDWTIIGLIIAGAMVIWLLLHRLVRREYARLGRDGIIPFVTSYRSRDVGNKSVH